jgi:hypothetical protein
MDKWSCAGWFKAEQAGWGVSVCAAFPVVAGNALTFEENFASQHEKWALKYFTCVTMKTMFSC